MALPKEMEMKIGKSVVAIIGFLKGGGDSPNLPKVPQSSRPESSGKLAGTPPPLGTHDQTGMIIFLAQSVENMSKKNKC